MSEILYNTNKLSKDICSVINKYLDFSLDNFKKKLNKTCIEKISRIKSDITLDDILMKCFTDGCIGFFFNKYSGINIQLQELHKSSVNKIIIKNLNDGDRHIQYRFDEDGLNRNGFCCDIMSFPEIFEIIIL